MSTALVCTWFGIEWPIYLYSFATQTTQHVLNHMVPPDPDAICRKFRRTMVIAEVPCDAGKKTRILATDQNQFLGGCPDLDPTAIGQMQASPI